MKYEDLNWETMEFLKTHTYRRLADPLAKSIENIEHARHTSNIERAQKKLLHTQYITEALLNTVNAWAALVSYRHHGPLDDFQFQPLTPDKIPAWFRSYFEQHIPLKLAFEHQALVQLETFLESILLLYSVASAISKVSYIQIADALPPKRGIYVRVVFFTAEDKAPFGNLGEIMAQFDSQNMAERDLAIQLFLARDMMNLNRAKFSLQNNKKTGQQAFSSFLAARSVTEASTSGADSSDEDAHRDQETQEISVPPAIGTSILGVLNREAAIRATRTAPEIHPDTTPITIQGQKDTPSEPRKNDNSGNIRSTFSW
jgi:hypothetical protein